MMIISVQNSNVENISLNVNHDLMSTSAHVRFNKKEFEKKRVEVVVSNGVEMRRLLWIEQSENGSFYWGLVVPDSDLHSSYHASGTFRSSRHHEPSERQKLSEFKGLSYILTIAVVKDVKRITYKPFELKELDGVFYIDFRAMKRDTVNIHLFLIEKDHLELLHGFLSKASSDLQMTIFAFMRPWLVITAQSF